MSGLGAASDPAPAPAAARSRTAVIVVHGVGDQAPGESAERIAGLLANLQTPAGAPAYTPFVRESIRVPVRPIAVPPHVAPGGTFAERGRVLRRTAAGPRLPDVGLEFMTTLLSQYEIDGPDETYETTVWSADRATTPNDPHVDVYEMYWADLSRLTQGVFRFFAETYELLFHLSSLGVHALTAAEVNETAVGTPTEWAHRVRAQRVAADAITVAIPILNLILMGLAAVLVADAVLAPVALPAALAIAGLLVVAGTAYPAYLWYSRPASSSWAGPLIAIIVVIGLATAAAVWAYVSPSLRSPDLVAAALATQVWFVVAIAIGGVLRAYDGHRPGAARAGAVLGVPISAWLLIQIWRPGHGSVGDAVLDAGALACLAMAACWIGFFLAGWVAVALGWRLRFEAWRIVRHAGGGPAHDAAVNRADRIGRVEWTALVTLSVPAALFVLVTTVIWRVLWMLCGSRVDAPVHDTAVLAFLEIFLRKTTVEPLTTAGAVVRAVIASAAAWGFGLLLAATAVAAVLGVVGLGASVLSEVLPPRRIVDGEAFGRWLDDGFRLLWAGGLLIWIGVFVVMPAGLVAVMLRDQVWGAAWARLNIETLTWVALALAPVATGLVAFSNRLKSLTFGLRTVVDAALDVDTYLREHPLSSTPRARIVARYSSLLRVVYARAYDRVIIVSHSQGTVITADLFRFIEAVDRRHPHLVAGLTTGGQRVSLFTMGSPLRQLYGRRFPHLYAWATHGVMGPCPPDMPIAATTLPDPRALGLERWVNAYRSGDYIGRHLWRSDECPQAYRTTPAAVPQPWAPGSIPAPTVSVDGRPPLRVEFCIGGGAHTHYWDRTAPAVALALDELVQ